MPTMKPVQIADHMTIGDFIQESLVVKIRCQCGHEREPRGEFIRRVIGAQTTIQELRRRLRCHKCGRRGAAIGVFRLPR